MTDYIIAVALILLVLALSIGVGRLVRASRQRHPGETKLSGACRSCCPGDE
ncbi:MAG: hypothetical protein OEV31_04815 [Gammaproteobacteria bacterium]|nr:hypothetical protein [Gammaproteobacteria bacterium]